MVLTTVLALHALFALVLWHEMRPKPLLHVAMHMNLDRALSVRLIDQPSAPQVTPPAAPLAPPSLLPPQRAAMPRIRPITHEPPHRDVMVVQDHQPAPASAASTANTNSLFAKDGSVHLPPTTPSYAAPATAQAKPAKSADDRQIMQHDSNRMHYKATRFEKYFPPPDETAGGAVGRHVGDALKAIANSLCDPKRPSSAANMLCGAPPLPPGPKEGDERLNLPASPLVRDDASVPAGPPLATCIDEYNNTKPLSDGCPLNTPALAFKAEMRVCIDLYKAGKRLKTWCPADTPDRAAAESKAPISSASAASH